MRSDDATRLDSSAGLCDDIYISKGCWFNKGKDRPVNDLVVEAYMAAYKLGERIKELEAENTRLKVTVNEYVAEITQLKIKHMEEIERLMEELY